LTDIHRKRTQMTNLQVRAEGVGFEPTNRVTPVSGFQDRRHRPLGEPSWYCTIMPLDDRLEADDREP